MLEHIIGLQCIPHSANMKILSKHALWKHMLWGAQ